MVSMRSWAGLVILLLAQGARADPIEQKPFGETSDHKPVEQITLTNKQGLSVKIITYGAIVTNLFIPDKNGKMGDIVLGCDSVKQYEETGPYFGCIPGRFAGRIAKGTFKLDNHQYALMVNSGMNTLHGGFKGYSKRVWLADTAMAPDGPTVRLTLFDPDGAEGFPGNVRVTVYYTLTNTNSLKIQYYATTDYDTPINLTHHSYFNLRDGGKTDVLGYLARIDADHYLPVDNVKIPTGEVAVVKGTAFDFTHFKPIGRDLQQLGGNAPGYDHTMVLNHPAGTFAKSAEVYDPESGRLLECWTTEPSVQFTSCSNLNKQPGKDGAIYNHSAAFCLEAQHFPDSPNHPEFPNTILHPGEVYRQITEYRFSVPTVPPATE
jgi:aldose 1-epimerase